MDSAELVIPGLDREDIGSLLNTRILPQYCEMVRRMKVGECPFCQLNTEINKVILENERWRAWDTPFNAERDHLERHVVISHRKHVTHLRDVDYTDGGTFFEILRALALPDNVSGGGELTRFGDPARNAGSIRHLHSNFYLPDGTGELRLPLCKFLDDIADKLKGIPVFEKMRLGGSFGTLEPEEQDLVRDRLEVK